MGLAPTFLQSSVNCSKSRFYENSLNYHAQSRRQYVDSLAVQRQYFAIDHHIHRPLELELDTSHGVMLRQRMPRMRAVVKRGQIPDQPQSPNRSPSHVLDQSVIGSRIGCDHHGTAGKFAVVKRQKQARARIELALIVEPHRKRSPLKTRQAEKNR